MKQSIVVMMLLIMIGITACNKNSEGVLMEEVNNLDITSEINIENINEDIEDNGEKILIAYFSLINNVPEGADAVTYATPSIGNTQVAATEIQRLVGGDLFAIETVQNYPVLHSEASTIAEQEMLTDARPELSTHVENMESYDVVYLGYPIWWYIEPMAIRSFLEEYDFSGKTIIPFCTSLGVRITDSVENISNIVTHANILEGITISTGREHIGDVVEDWIEDRN